MTPLELLAPAQNIECGMAAIDHGADAVYIGAGRFGAREAAGNSLYDIKVLTDYAHQYGSKVYVTVNTIVFNDELPDASMLLSRLSAMGVDAVLIQDMGLLASMPKDLPIHASTQTDNRTPEKVGFLRSLGFRRVVLARELSTDEIRLIHQQVPDVELEVFVHGALCVSYSGLCYASSACFNRSANRGECAQFCRMAFDLIDADGNELEHQRHLLSLKDLNLSQQLEQLAEAGATSFKIEGRLKGLAYVKNITAYYNQKLNQLIARHPDKYCRSSKGTSICTFTPDPARTFNRGYTTYFCNGRQPAMSSPDTPKSIGEEIGTVVRVFPRHQHKRDANAGTADTTIAVRTNRRLNNGDGLCFFNNDRRLEGFRVNNVQETGLRQGTAPAPDTVVIAAKVPPTLSCGARLYRNMDHEFDALLSKPSARRKIDISMVFEATGTGFRLKADHVVVDAPFEHQPAQTPQRENISRQLTRLGGTPFQCTQVEMADDFPYFVPSSLLAKMRRHATSQLIETAQEEMSRRQEPTGKHPAEAAPHPTYPIPYLYNIANTAARQFYEANGYTDLSPAFELKKQHEALIMQCRYCLKNELGFCPRHGGTKPTWTEPLHLRLADKRTFRLEFDCKACLMKVFSTARMLIAALCILLTSCYQQELSSSDAWNLTQQQEDSISFYTTHHYSENYNFLVRADSMSLILQNPTEAISGLPVDTINVFRDDRIVVADIVTLPLDEEDSIWIKVARDQHTIGWTHETALLKSAVPDKPISLFINYFSDTHLLLFLAFTILFALAYFMMTRLHQRVPVVYFNDIASPLPAMLPFIVALSATAYSSIQLFMPEAWRHFYYHPTLNPFSVPPVLGFYLLTVWAILIFAIASFDEARRSLSVRNGIVYMFGLIGACILSYMVFTITTLYFVGYPMLAVYAFWLFRWMRRQVTAPMLCGSCHKPITAFGKCPHCGAINDKENQ